MLELLRLRDGADPLNEDDYPWIDDKECGHRTRSDFLTTNYLGFCGCGDPESVMWYVMGMLERCSSDIWDFQYHNMDEMFFLYWADDKKYIEHGTTIRCSWRTDLGNQLLADMRTLHAESVEAEAKELAEEALKIVESPEK